jgi:response regulator RpfG family c-di-GMP phosphodiesterase
MTDKILFVDDEPNVLEGYKRSLHRDFALDTAMSGEEAIAAIRNHGPYAIVISDMRMPGMNGAQLLAQARQIAPDTIRMLLTGYTDLDAAMAAVNEGNIFRFLTKPCEKQVLVQTISAGLLQYRLVMAEKEILEKTLMGSIKVLTEVLSAASPEAFGRSTKIARYVRHLVGKFALPDQWRFEAAAMLSQLGCVTIDPDVIRASYLGSPLSPENRIRFQSHPRVAKDFLVNIPRLEPIAWMISRQLHSEHGDNDQTPPEPRDETIVFGAKILRLAVALEDLTRKGLTDEQAIARLQNRRGEFGPELLAALAGLKQDTAKMEPRRVSASRLEVGMILQQDIKTRLGMLVVPSGQEITQALLIRLDNYSRSGTIEKEILVLTYI